jgi:hypothetical protein
MLREFKKQQIMRQIVQQDTGRQQFVPERSLPAEKNSGLKKQSQFAPDLMGVTPFMEGGYGNIPAAGTEENKPNQSQLSALSSPEGIGKREKPPSEANRLTG